MYGGLWQPFKNAEEYFRLEQVSGNGMMPGDCCCASEDSQLRGE